MDIANENKGAKTRQKKTTSFELEVIQSTLKLGKKDTQTYLKD